MAGFAVSCTSIKPSVGKNAAHVVERVETAEKNMCSRAVNYYIDKSISTNDAGAEKEKNTTVKLIMDPVDTQFTMIYVEYKKSYKKAKKVENYSLTKDMKTAKLFLN